MLESNLWQNLKKSMGDKWRTHRIENSVNASTPDILFTIMTKNRRSMGMIELKCQTPNSSNGICASHYTQGQRDFAILHRSTYLFLHSKNTYFLFDWTCADEILRGQSFDWHKNKSLWHDSMIDPISIIKIITNGLS